MSSDIRPENLRQWGIVGAGGAGFPAEVKCGAKAEMVIANAAECEPLLHKDKELLKAFPSELISGLSAVMKMTGASKGVIGIKEKYTEVINSLKQILPENISIHPLGDFYPAGDEFILVYTITRRVIPPGGLPIHVGCVVNNVETLINIGRARPVVEKYLTVAGAVKKPATICVPIGITFRECLALAGGATIPEPVALVGGAMMGTLCTDWDAPVTKTTGGLIILPAQHTLIERYKRTPRQIQRIGRSACDQCTYCTELCPRYLLGHPIQPHIAMRRLGFPNIEPIAVAGSLYCCECNLCTLWSCPEDLDPRAACIECKSAVRAAEIVPHQKDAKPHPLINGRCAPVKRLMKRLGLSEFVNKGPLQEKTAETDKVRIPLKQHIGVPAEAKVAAGQYVKTDELIAAPPDGKLGACIHASISGRVVSVDSDILIERG